jgi:hypothetical protein
MCVGHHRASFPTTAQEPLLLLGREQTAQATQRRSSGHAVAITSQQYLQHRGKKRVSYEWQEMKM